MAHEVESMIFKGETPWHGLGTQIGEEVGFKEAFDLSGLNWKVETRPLFRQNGEAYEDVNEHAKVVVRTTDNRILGVVGPRWTPLQNEDAFGIFEPMIESKLMKIETAGSLRMGERVWVLCSLNLDPSVIVPGDEVRKFALLSNGHDGKLAVRFGFTPIRVVCANTLALAHGDEASNLIRVRHHKFVKQNVEKLREVMNLANQQFETTAEGFRDLARRQINAEDLAKYVKVVFDMDETEENGIVTMATRTKNKLDEITKLFEAGKGNSQEGVRGTWWAAYNAVAEYLSYGAGRNADNRMDSLWFGVNGNKNQLALKLALALSQK